ATGEVSEEREVTNINYEQVANELKSFTGKISQIPPMVSAVHHNGTRLYKLARQGIEVERKAREVEVYSLKIIYYELPLIGIEINCQSGTYIRTIADDLGQKLGCGAHLSKLERTVANEFFHVSDSIRD